MGDWSDFFSLSSRKNKPSDAGIGGAEGKRRINSGALNQVFDLLTRPGKAVSTSVYNLGDDDESTTFQQGIVDGLTGKSQTNWSDILAQHGVTNPIANAVGGFIGDVALDPTTYVGLETVKGANMAEATANIAREIGTTGAARTPQATSHLIASRLADVQRNNPAHIYATFAGKKISPNIKTAPVKALAQKFTGPEGDANVIAKAFSMEQELPFGLAKIKRQIDSANASDYNQGHREVGKLFDHLTEDQARSISFAIDNGESLDHVPTDWNGHAPIPGLDTLGNYKRLATSLMRSMGEDEAAMGTLKGPLKDNYIPRYFKERPDAYPGLSRAASVRTQRGDIDAARKAIDSLKLQHLYENKGYEPEVNIGRILKQRMASHYRKDGRSRFVVDAVERFGIKKTAENEQFLKDNNYLNVGDHLGSKTAKTLYGDTDAQMYLPRKIVKTMNSVEELLTDNNVAGDMLHKVDWINRQFKLFNTIISPGYWIRNSLSDSINNASNGVLNPAHYRGAAKVLKENRAASTAEWMNAAIKRGLDSGDIDPGMAANAMHQPGKFTTVKIGPHDVDTNVVWQRYLKEGGRSGDIVSNTAPNMDPEATEAFGQQARRQIQKLGQKKDQTINKIADVNALREDAFRLSHFISAADKKAKQGASFEDAFVHAGEEVGKGNVDYGKLSTWEKSKARRAIPFYSWMRGNLPKQVAMLATRPGFMALYPKTQDLLQNLMQTDDGSGDELVPEWIRNSMPVRLATGDKEAKDPITKLIRLMAGSKAGDQDSSVFLPLLSTSLTPAGDLQTITNPIQKFANEGGLSHPAEAGMAGVSEIFRELLNQSTPVAKMPIEAAFQKSAFTGGPIKEWGPWAFGQVVPGRTAYNLSQVDEAKGRSGLAGTFLGIAPQAVTQSRQKGEMQRRKDEIEHQGLNDDAAWKLYMKQLRRIVGEPVADDEPPKHKPPTYKPIALRSRRS